MPNCSTGRLPYSGIRSSATARGLVICTRSRAPRETIRRPSSTAASTCAARALADPTDRHEIVVPRTREPFERRRPPSSSVFARSSALSRGWPCPSTIATSSLSPSAAAPRRASFSRGRSCGATAFIVHHPCYTARRCCSTARALRASARRLLACALLLCAACSEPPQKEIDRAQGAIDAARAAGADQYAPDDFQRGHERAASGPSGRRATRLPSGAVTGPRRERARARSRQGSRQRQGARTERSGRAADHDRPRPFSSSRRSSGRRSGRACRISSGRASCAPMLSARCKKRARRSRKGITWWRWCGSRTAAGEDCGGNQGASMKPWWRGRRGRRAAGAEHDRRDCTPTDGKESQLLTPNSYLLKDDEKDWNGTLGVRVWQSRDSIADSHLPRSHAELAEEQRLQC